MLEQLISSVKGNVLGDLTEKVGIPTDKIDDVLKVAGQVATKEVVKETTQGGLNTVMNLFSGASNNTGANSLQSNITNGIVSQLMEKVGLDGTMAKMAASYVVPAVIAKITGKNSETPDDDTSSLQSMFGLGGGDSKDGGLMGKISDFF